MSKKNNDASPSVCGYCQCEFSSVKISCSQCKDLHLCLQCFACGAEVGTHKKEHDYTLQVLGEQSIFSQEKTEAETKTERKYSSAEEIMLLDAVEQYGFGNWVDVSSHVETKSHSDLQDHYMNYYINGSIGKATFPLHIHTNVSDHTCPNGGPLSPSLSALPPPPPADLGPPEQRLLGYMPLREDFERECDNEAESTVGSLSLNYDDDDVDIAVKISEIDAYRMRVRDREKRKRIVREYNLVCQFLSLQAVPTKQKPSFVKKKTAKDEKEIREKTKVFCQFHSNNEHEQLFENLQKMKGIKSRIKELVRYRKNGIAKLDDIEAFEEDKFRREKKKEHSKKKMSSLYPSKRTSTALKKDESKLELLLEEGGIISDDIVEEARELAAMPGYVMLSSRERRLCTSIGMIPANYITIKTCIIKDYIQRRRGIPVKIRYPSSLDKTHRRKIMNFLSDNGWISGVS